MQQAECKAVMVNDIGLLSVDQVPAFRAFLVAKSVVVRDSGAGQYFHFQLPGVKRWLPVERGRAGAPVTPDVLREYICQFNKKPLHAAMDVSRQPVTGEIATPANSDPAGTDALLISLQGGTDAIDTSLQDMAQLAPVSFTPSSEPRPLKAAAPLSRYLSDLRDDFALHAPVVLPAVFTAEQLERSVQLRWRYADLMIKHRTTMAGD